MSRRVREQIALALLLAAAPAAAEEAGVLAELPFLDGGAGPGNTYERHIRLDLSPQPKQRPFPMLLDTGASQTVMSPRWARALRVNVRRTRDDYYRKKTILGRELLFRVDTSWSDTRSSSYFEYGLLGGDFLRDYVVEIDYQAGRVRFLDPELHAVDEQRAEPGELVLPMGLVNGVPTVRIGVGSGALNFMMDTGMAGSLLVSEEKAAEIGVEVPENAKVVRGGNVLGRDVAASFYVPGVRLGPRLERHVVLGVSLREGSTYRITNLAGPDEAILGNRFLSRHRVRFDYTHSRVGLLPRVVPTPPEAAVAALPQGTIDGSRPPQDARLQPIFVPVDLSPARSARRHEQEVWVELVAAQEGLRVASPVAYYDLSGWSGAGQPLEHDVMMVIDTSGSTAVASGSDVDGDGKVGRRSRRKREAWRNFNPAYLSNDPGDTVLAAELLATRRLVERMGAGRTRIGIISFSSEPRIEAKLGSDEKALARAFRNLDAGFGSGMTNMQAAIDLAAEALLVARPPVGERRQSILMLSDGYPSAPEGRASAAAYEAAREAADLGIRIYSFALGLGQLESDDVFVEMALVSGGGHVRLEDPAEIVHELARVNLTEVTAIAIRNETAGMPARATRVFPDGSFDGLVPLEPGTNRVVVTAHGDAGGVGRAQVLIEYLPISAADAPEQVEAFQRKLQVRTIETELGRRHERPAPSRELEVDVEDGDEG